MEKEFLEYTEALQLKELGFDEPCFGHYLNKKFYLKEYHKQGNGITLRSTYSQAFRWFRLKYGYLSYIDMDTYSFYRYTIYKGKGISDAPYETYEEAELECLKKLIEIAKTK